MNKMRMRSPKVAVKKSVKGVKMKPLPAKKKKLSMSKEMEASISETISYVIKGKFSPIKAATDAKKSASLVKKQLKVQSDLSKNTTKKILPKKVEKILVKKKEPIKKEAAKVKIVERKVKAKKEIKKVEEPKVQVVKRQKSPAKPDNPETKQTKDKVVKEKKDVPEKKVKKAETKSKPKPKTEINKEVKTVKPKKKPPPKPKATLKVKKRPIKQIKPTRAKEKPKEIKKEIATPEDSANESPSSPPTPEPKKTKSIPKKRPLNSKELAKRKADQQRCRKMKLYNFWNGPKRHRVASLNAIAKVHCLYENESRSNILDQMEIKREQIIERKLTPSPPIKTEADSPPPTRTLRSVPGLRAVGKMWDMHDTTSSSEDYTDIEEEVEVKPVEVEVKKEEKKPPKKRRKKAEIIMDLKDMVVRKRMASLNATAILAASYSVEKRGIRGDDSDSETESDSSEHYSSDEAIPKKKCYDEDVKKEEIIEVRATPNKKVAVIVNQDTDVTITGVYVNSTTRSTHHEGFCSIAGMQYRISATSHTQTAATAVATETILQSASTSSQENANVESPPSKSYTPLDALTNMQPPAGSSTGGVPLSHHHLAPPHGEISPLSRRGHGCSTSAFSAPPGPCGPQGHHHLPPEHGYMPGYYQPAGPLISVPHGHSQPPVGKSVPLSEPSPSLTPPPPIHQPPPPSSAGDSSDSEVIITSVTTAKEASAQASSAQPSQQYRINHYPPSHTAYPYGYPQQYYTAPPPAPAYSHHDICYPPYHKYMYRRYPLPGPQYYSSTSPDLYNQPQNSTNQQVVTATSVSSASSYPPAPGGPPTLIETYPPHPPTLVETYPPPPPPPHYYPGYGPAPPACYNHASPSRPLNYINATYQSCPCPMQSCPKNVHTGPLAGDSKRSNISIAKESVPLPPVALALPLEPASATGPPSPARGSAGMPPPPSPAGATYQPPPPKQETPEPPDLKPVEKKRKARVGKAMVRNTMAANQNTMLLMCHAPLENVKREVESPKETEVKKIEDVVQEKIEEIVETKVVETEAVKIEEVEKSVDVLPCQKTVAENVKVKNMKRKLSVKESVKVEASPTKKIKSEKSNGSYKDFIKKTPGTIVKINNGKRKLITDCGRKLFPRHRFRKPTKRKLSPLKEESAKRLKSSKPLTASNLHNSKQNSKESKEKSFVDTELIENKEPTRKTKKTVNLKAPNKKIPPPVLDNIITKNNVDRTIESVISEICGRTSKSQEPPSAVIRTEKCKRETPAKKSTKTKTKPDPKNAKKTKCKEVPQIVKVPRRSIQLRWSNGWRWEGNPFEGKVFLNSDEATVNRTCYPAMRHEEGDIIEPRDCVLLKAGQRKNELPFVAKIAALWENPDDGEMMMSLLWYYRPEHTEQGRLPTDQPDEVFASRHKDSNSVACIEDKCYVLTFNEYCRYRKNLRRLEMGIEPSGPRIPLPEAYPRTCRQPPMTVPTSPDMVFFCRRVYDFRQKRIVKNPS